jgi:hypothetical protein
VRPVERGRAHAADDSNVSDEAPVWRRIPEWHAVPDANTGERRVSSAAFQDDDGSPMSVILPSPGRDPSTALAELAVCGIAEFTAGFARSLGQVIVRAPEPDEPEHPYVVGHKSRATRRAFCRGSHWAYLPTVWADVVLT